MFKLLNQNNKILGAFSRLEDALKSAKILLHLNQNQKIFLQRVEFKGELLEEEIYIEEIEIID